MNERVSLYASSLYNVAQEEKCEKEVHESLALVKAVLSENGEYMKIMSSAAIALEERERLLEEAFSGNVHPYVLNFMKLLSKKRAFEILPTVAESYEKAYFKNNNIERAKITTAIELGDEKKAEILKRISSSTGKEILGEFLVDEALMGGIVIETEQSSIDASLSGKLESVKRYISKI